MEPTDSGRRMGHEFIGIVDAVGADVQTIKRGDLVVSPFLWSDGTCVFCRETPEGYRLMNERDVLKFQTAF